MTMQAPTSTQIRTAIEVLEKLGEHINEHAAGSVRQIPPSSVNGLLAGQISVNAMEQTNQVGEITGLLKTWHGELEQRRRQNVSYHV
jgi:hypothetical protein